MECSEIVQHCESRLGEVDVYECCLVSTLVGDAGRSENRLEFLAWVREIAEEQFTEPWGFIGNRENVNATDPSLLAEARRALPLWRSFAVVGHSPYAKKMFELESLALKDFPHKYFVDLQSAMLWTEGVIQNVRGQS